ncbi:MAG: ATP-binding protein [Nitrospirota bacterium]|jgi:anti-sigma regulatory factor (Ser/Thr protein kinase)
MALDAIAAKDFRDREEELARLRALASREAGAAGGNVLLAGPRGVGKSELLKQVHGALFWEDPSVIPFYYRFRRGTLKGAYFARDYFSRFLRQLLAALKRDPSLIENMGVPLTRLLALAPGERFPGELLEDFREQVAEGDLPGQILAALSAPLRTAESMGRRVVVLLDDFHLAAELFERAPADTPWLVSLFEGSMKSPLVPHVLAGSTGGALEAIFTDDSIRGTAERLSLAGLPEDTAFALLKDLSESLGVAVAEDVRGVLAHLGGNPLYIGHMARALSRARLREAGRGEFWECYVREVLDGETAFYWSSVLRGALPEAEQVRPALEMLMQAAESPFEVGDLPRLARLLHAPEQVLREALAALFKAGMLEGTWKVRCIPDEVLRDFLRGRYRREVQGQRAEAVREGLLKERMAAAGGGPGLSFEVVIPMVADAELFAAKAVEQVAGVLKLREELVNQLQLALIEACINAMEHSGSYEKKIFLRFTAEPERLEIVIESPGRPFEAPETGEAEEEAEGPPTGRRRGWGLKIMRRVMDDIRVERTEDRTRVVLTKKITPKEVRQ